MMGYIKQLPPSHITIKRVKASASFCLLSVIILFGLSVFAANDINSDDQTISVERAEDIVGCWKRINFYSFEMKALNKFEPWPLKYQWFCFYRNGDLRTMMVTEDQKVTEKELKVALERFPAVMKYYIARKGIVCTEHKEVQEKHCWVSAFIPKDDQYGSQLIKKGSLLMTLSNPSGKDDYYRFLERMQ